MRVGIALLVAVVIGVACWLMLGEELELWLLERQSDQRLEQVASSRPNDPWPAYVLGTRYAEQGRIESAMDQFERARNLAPQKYQPHFSLGLGFLRLNSPGAAVPELARAAELEPSSGRVQIYLGSALRQVDQYRDAVTAGEKSVKLLPKDAEAWYQLGLTYYRPNGQQGKGRECFTRAVELNPRNAAYRRDLASSFSDIGEYKLAEPHARAAVNLTPQDPIALYLLGNILHRSAPGTKEAADVLRKAVELSPGTFQPHYELGLIAEEAGDYKEALEEFRASSQIDARHQQAWFHQANVATRLGLTAEAALARSRFQALTRDRDERQFLERRVFDHPNDAALRLKLAALFERNNQLVAAAAQCQAILKNNPQHAQARMVLTRLAKKAGVTESGEPAKP